MNKRIVGVLLCLALMLSALTGVFSAVPAQAAASTEIHVVKVGPDGITIIAEQTITVATMEATLSVQGDGTTHYYSQGPTFVPANPLDPAETLNLKDKGALKGTDVKDLCHLVGDAVAGDQIEIRANDGYGEYFQYQDVYTPEPAQGKFVACWWVDYGDGQGGKYVPSFADGIQLVLFAQTTNGAGQYVFGHQDMHDTLPEANWHYFYQVYPVGDPNFPGINYPSANGLSVKNISEIVIHQQAPPQWHLQLAGALNVDISQAEFENGVACHGAATWTDPITSDNWSGLPLWLLVGEVDDGNQHGSGAFNDALAAHGDYNVKVIASDGYSKTFASTLVANNNNIFVANKLNGNSLPSNYYPLRLAGPTLTGGQKVSKIVEIELIFVPRPDLVVTEKHETWVNPGSTYTVTYTVKNQGNAAAGASTTEITADGDQTKTMACPALDIGATSTVTTDAFNFSNPNDTIVVKADSTNAVVESLDGENNNTLQNALTYLVGVAVSVTGESYEAHASVVDQVVNPAVSYDPLTFAVEVTNTGLLDDKYELTVADQLGWTLKLDPNELFVMAADPDQAEYAALSVTVPQDTLGGVSNQITVTATGKMASENGVVIGPIGSYTITVTTGVVNSVQIELLPGTTEPQTGAPGSPISWLAVVKNTSNVGNSFRLAVTETITGKSSFSAHDTWSPTFSPDPGAIPIAALTKWTSYLKVTVPADAKTSEWNEFAITITGTGCSDTYVVKAHALEPGPRLPEGAVEVSVEDEVVAIDCLGTMSYDFGVMQEGTTKSTPTDNYFTIRNTGNVAENILVRGQDALSMPGEPSAKWVIAPVPGLDQFTMVLNPHSGVATSLDNTTLGKQIWTAVSPSAEVQYGLTLWTPTAISTPARMWMRIMIYVVAS
ncbi:MAG: hypothetical protein NTZ04_01835 [Chloroflexi bacterium]|nr:hypothetical protein [Chloroflexota bacterium]